ncbi:MAG: Ig-like domain-containing protein [Myxococcota bacterium]
MSLLEFARHHRWSAVALGAMLGTSACTSRDAEPSPDTGAEAPAPAPAPAALDLWAGVPPLEAQPSDLTAELTPRPGPLKPESVSETIEIPFGAPEAPGAGVAVTPPTGPLAVERFGPTGPQGLVDAVRVSFNESMVPLATVEALETKDPPLLVDPPFESTAQWMGTRTLALTAKSRLPYSTTYTVTVPTTATSIHGHALPKAKSWTFSTPTLALESSSPMGTEVDLDATVTLRFNQAIQTTALAGALSFKGGGRSVPFEVVPSTLGPDATEAQKQQAARVLTLRPKAKLSKNTSYTIKIPAGVFGEGPDKGPALTHSFRTFGPLKVSLVACGSPCWASNGIQLETTNQLADPKLDERVTVTPPVDNLSVSGGWGRVYLQGDFEGNTRYTVEVAPELQDRFGQTLGKRFKGSIKLGPQYPALSMTQSRPAPLVVERGGTPSMKLRVTGLDAVELQATSVPLDALHTYSRGYWDRTWTWPSDRGTASWTKTFDVTDSKRKAMELPLDLADMIRGKGSVGWMLARSNEYEQWGSTQRQGFGQMFAVTDLAIASALDYDDGVIAVHTLSTNAPMQDATVTVYNHSGTELWSGRTDADGRVDPSWAANDPGFIVAQTADDAAYLPVGGQSLSGGWRMSRAPEDTPRAFIFSERTPYKPGETIHLAGVVRKEVGGPTGGLEAWRENSSGTYVVTTPRGIEVANGTVEISAMGTFTLDIETKEEHGTGDFSVQLTFPSWFTSDRTFYHSVPVQTFRTPEFEVAVKRPTSVPLVFGDTLAADVKASYLHGAPMVGANVSWSLDRSDSGFTPPGDLNRDFAFGGNGGSSSWRWWSPPSRSVTAGSGTTEPDGTLRIDHLVAAIDPPLTEAQKAAAKPEDSPAPPRAATYSLSATVTDENRQAISSQASFVVHPATVYVGLRTDARVLKEGETTELQAVLVDLAGERVAGSPIAVEVVRQETVRTAVETNGRWSFKYETKEEPVSTCKLESRGVPVTCDVTAGKAGSYLLRGTAKDDAGRQAQTQTQLFVVGSDAVVWNQGSRRVDLVPDRSKYAPGDTANILVRSPFDEAHGVLLVEREGIAERKPLEVRGGSAAVALTLADGWAPGVTVSAMLWRGRMEIEGAPAGQDLGMPAAAGGTVDLDISTDAHRIDVDVELSAAEIQPKGTLTVDLSTTDAKGNPAPAGVALMVVDEGVLSLMNYTTPDPLAFFVRKRQRGVWMNALHTHVLPRQAGMPEPDAEPEPEVDERAPTDDAMPMEESMAVGMLSAPQSAAAPGGATTPRPAPSPSKARKSASKKSSTGTRHRGEEGKLGRVLDADRSSFRFDAGEAMAQEVSLRTLFASTAYFDGDLKTDDDGKLSVTIDMPENLTTFRVMAVAVDAQKKDRFGSGDAQVRVRKAVMLRPSMPRFANYGDAFEASVMVDNQTGDDQKVLVGTRGLNVTVGSDDQKFVDIPAGQSKEVRFDMKTQEVGTMRVQFAAMSSAGRDATEVEVPVHYPATAEAFADYGMTADSVTRALEPPEDVLPAFGGLELSFSSTALSGLEDAVQYLVEYRYECAEQTASRMLPIFVLGKVLDEFPIASIRDDVRRRALSERGMRKLFDKQNYDGGFGYWYKGESWPYVSTWATFAILEGKKAGYDVDQAKLDSALNYVENFVRRGDRTRWGRYYDWTSRAFGLWLLSRESRGRALFDNIWSHRDEMPLYARAYLLSAAVAYGRTTERDEVLAEIREAVVESPKAIHFVEARSEAAAADGLRVLMHSNVQTDATVLMALLDATPEDPMVPKVMAGIMASRDPMRGGRWGSTHTNAWALLAASRYYEVVEGEEPDFEAQAWLGDAFAGSFTFQGRSMTKQQQTVPMKALLDAAAKQLTLAKKGPGKLYYRLGLRYAPADLQLDAREQGFVVSRTYEALPETGAKEADPDAVRQLNDGSWVIKAGTNVKVSLNVVVRDRANYVVVDDALPAGFEGLNPKFATTTAAAVSGVVTRGTTGIHRRWWYPWWTFDHSDLRDDRMLLFADALPAGVYTYAYTARATTIGDFLLPPVKAEAMYEPERFGHSSSSRVKVVE